MDQRSELQENIGLEEFTSGAHGNNPILHCDRCDKVPSSRLPVPGPYSQWAVCASHAIMSVANKPVEDLITGMFANYTKRSG
jgi:hypothetical protein